MSRLDRAMVAGLTLVLVVIGGSLAVPRPAAQLSPTPAPSDVPGTSDAPAAVYREGVVGQPSSVTPITARSRSERTLVGLIFSGLVKLGPDDTFQPDLAASWDIDTSGQVWVFHIRPEANWQDGAPVTADDVAFTVDALKGADASGVEAAAWAEVDVKVVDDKTVQFTLGSPIAGFLAALTQPLLPKHLLDGQPISDLANSPFSRQPVGSGPYVLTSLDSQMAVLVPTVSPDAVATPSASPGASPSASASGGPGASPTASGSPGASGASPSASATPSATPSRTPSGTAKPTPSSQTGAIPNGATVAYNPSSGSGSSLPPAAVTSPSPTRPPRPSSSPSPSPSASPTDSPTPTPAPSPTPVPNTSV